MDPWEKFQRAMEHLCPAGQVVVGVSGGADSMALLHLLCAWNKSASVPLDLVALTVDHGLRPESAQEALGVKTWAEELGVVHHTLTWAGDKPTGNIEAKARAARYHLMGNWCLENGAGFLMTAHHQDDQAETFLMRLVRGSGVSGLGAMEPERPLGKAFGAVRLLRPLLDIAKDDLKALLEEVAQPWFEDPSNMSDDFTRSRLRNLSQTFEGLGLGVARTVATAQRMSEARVVLENAADDLWEAVAVVSKFGEVCLQPGELLAAPVDTRRRVLSRALKGVSGSTFGPRYERLVRLETTMAEGKIGNGVTLHGCKVTLQGGNISIIRESSRALAATCRPGEALLWDGRFHIVWPEPKQGHEIRCLGEEGLKVLKGEGWTACEGHPGRDVLITLPAAWEGDQLRAVPLLDKGGQIFKAHFILTR